MRHLKDEKYRKKLEKKAKQNKPKHTKLEPYERPRKDEINRY